MHLPLSQDVFLKGVTDLSSLDVAAEHAKLAKSSDLNNRNSLESSSVVTPQALLALPAGSLKSTFREAYSLLAAIVHKLGWEGMLNTRSKVFVMEGEWRQDSKSTNDITLNSNSNSNPSITGLKSNAKNTPAPNDIVGEFRKKRLCERWLDNLFMLLYEDMKAYTYFRAQEMQADSMTDSSTNANGDTEGDTNNTNGNKSILSDTLGLWGGVRSRSNSTSISQYKENDSGSNKTKIDPYTESRSCLEWELIGLVSERLGHMRDAQRCYERALARRFSVRAARKLVGIYSRWRERARKQIGIQGKLQYALNTHNKNTAALLNQSKWNTSSLSINGSENSSNVYSHNAGGNLNASSLSISNINSSSKNIVPIRDPMKYDTALLRLVVGLLVWDYRWYTLFSPILLDTLTTVVNDMGVTKVESEVRVWFEDIKTNRGVLEIVKLSVSVLERWDRVEAEV